uniref:Uncharacterized protein n=1 Tax=Aegilops tauschii subsp. strangulata TaxID=200361 RepID=A0A453NBI3_AEGTS
ASTPTRGPQTTFNVRNTTKSPKTISREFIPFLLLLPPPNPRIQTPRFPRHYRTWRNPQGSLQPLPRSPRPSRAPRGPLAAAC